MAEDRSSQKSRTVAKRSQNVRGAASVSKPSLHHRTYYFNRELSWLEFNRRVLEEALDESHPLLERVKFLAIFTSNLDEFFMIRVSGLRNQLLGGTITSPLDGLSPSEQLVEISRRLQPMLATRTQCWQVDLLPKLHASGIRILAYDQLRSKQRKLLRRHFECEILPALTPLAFDPSHPFPHISNLSINLAVLVRKPGGTECFARLKVPHLLSRLLRIPSEENAGGYDRLGLEVPVATNFVWLEEVVAANLDLLFPGVEVISAFPFRVTRDADLEIKEDEASDLISAMQEVVGQRHFGSAVRLEVDSKMPEAEKDMLAGNLGLAPYQVFPTEGPLGLSDLWELMDLDRPDLKDPVFLAKIPQALASEESIFSTLKKRDVLLYHPYDSFSPVVDFVRSAAEDPDVVAIKQTLYRAGPSSPIVKALRDARENGKQVLVLVELKARFDEANNIGWARALEKAGVHVVYGVLGLKTHAKMCLVVRREPAGLRCYCHLGTGNYNPVTARLYTDLGFLTSRQDLTADVADLFNALTGYSEKSRYRRLLVSPRGMRKAMLDRISREIAQHEKRGDGHIAFKCNSLADGELIKALYRASQAGVKVDLQIRGICCLRPGVARVSETITVTSVVGRFLEHSRIYYFHNGGEEEILLGSADLMPRNLDGRVETLFPIDDPKLLRAIRDEILFLHLRDNVRCGRLLPNGSYERLRPDRGEPAVDSQNLRLAQEGSWNLEVAP